MPSEPRVPEGTLRSLFGHRRFRVRLKPLRFDRMLPESSASHAGERTLTRMAPRWVDEQTVDTITETVTIELKVKKVILEDSAVRSPISKEPTMSRTYYAYIMPGPTEIEEALQSASRFADEATARNERQILAEFAEAAQQQQRQRDMNRKKDQKRRERNQQQFGTAKRPKTAASTPATAAEGEIGRVRSRTGAPDTAAAIACTACELH